MTSNNSVDQKLIFTATVISSVTGRFIEVTHWSTIQKAMDWCEEIYGDESQFGCSISEDEIDPEYGPPHNK